MRISYKHTPVYDVNHIIIIHHILHGDLQIIVSHYTYLLWGKCTAVNYFEVSIYLYYMWFFIVVNRYHYHWCEILYTEI